MSGSDILPSPLWRGLLPWAAIAYETRRFDHASQLYPQERWLVRNAVAKRVEEFAAGRLCARTALAELGMPDAPLLRGEDRRPIWPPGIVGSITHTDDYCAAVVAWERDCGGIGIDAEAIGRLDDRVQRHVCRPEELKRLEAMAPDRRQDVATLIFSAKEAYYKSHTGFGDATIGFQDAELVIGDDHFVVEPRRNLAKTPGAYAPVRGAYALRDGLVFTGIFLPPSGAPG